MKWKENFLLKIENKYKGDFVLGDHKHKSLHNLLDEIINKGMLENENKPVIFSFDICGNLETQLVLVYSSGGHKNTGVFFICDDYNKCCSLIEEFNGLFFLINKEEQMELMVKSMFEFH